MTDISNEKLKISCLSMESPWQTSIPDSVLLDIFWYLGIEDLGHTAQVCKQWARVSSDNSLWHKLARLIWKINGSLLPQSCSWREEVKRLYYHVPLIETNCIQEHTDEVLDVAISNNGKYFCTVSKDSQIIMWDMDDPTVCICKVDTSKDLDWLLTQYSVFNNDDTRLLVCGVRNLTPEQEINEPSGCGAVYTVPDLQLAALIFLEPFTLFGAWLDNRIFIAGLSDLNEDRIHMRAYCCGEWSSEPFVETSYVEKLLTHYADHQTGLFSYDGSRLHQMNVMIAKVPVSHSDTALHPFRKNKKLHISSTFWKTNSLLDKNRNHCDVADMSVSSDEVNNSFDAKGSEKTDFLCSNEMDCRSDIAFNPAGAQETVFDSSQANMLSSGYRTYVLLVAGEHDVILLFEVTEEKIAEIQGQFDNMNYNKDVSVVQPDYLFDIQDSYITGLCLSQDHRFAYYNHRNVSNKAVEGDADERAFSAELKIGVIDLVRMEIVEDIEYKGHVGYSKDSPWYICLDVSQDFVLSGSEDGRSYIWEKNYNTCLGTLNHTEGVVNGVAFSPIDQETCVTVCDDKLIKVWRSRYRKQQIEKRRRDRFCLLSESDQMCQLYKTM